MTRSGRLILSAGMLALLAFACRGREIQSSVVLSQQETLQDKNIDGKGTKSEVLDEDSVFTTSQSAEEDELMLPGSEAPEVPFPRLPFAAKDVPASSSDLINLTLPIEADTAYSHYAAKYSSTNDCNVTKGYSVFERSKPFEVAQELMPNGPIFLCMIAYHFPSKRWQPASEALVYNWQKVPLKRTIETTFDMLLQACTTPTRTNVRSLVTINGTSGTYRWTVINPPGCSIASGTGTSLLTNIKVSGPLMEGKFIDSGVEGWFKFNFTNNERTSFKGSWGLASDLKVIEGAWNSDR